MKKHLRISTLAGAAAISLLLGATAIAVAEVGTGNSSPATGRDMGGGMMHDEHMAPDGMHVKVRVLKDPVKGWNVYARTWGLTWAPMSAGRMHRDGYGHAHLYVDGKKVTRMYSEWYYLGPLKSGRHTVRVTLNANDHGDYVRNERAVADSQTITVP